jgi:hypothetical protein
MSNPRSARVSDPAACPIRVRRGSPTRPRARSAFGAGLRPRRVPDRRVAFGAGLRPRRVPDRQVSYFTHRPEGEGGKSTSTAGRIQLARPIGAFASGTGLIHTIRKVGLRAVQPKLAVGARLHGPRHACFARRVFDRGDVRRDLPTNGDSRNLRSLLGNFSISEHVAIRVTTIRFLAFGAVPEA